MSKSGYGFLSGELAAGPLWPEVGEAVGVAPPVGLEVGEAVEAVPPVWPDVGSAVVAVLAVSFAAASLAAFAAASLVAFSEASLAAFFPSGAAAVVFLEAAPVAGLALSVFAVSLLVAAAPFLPGVAEEAAALPVFGLSLLVVAASPVLVASAILFFIRSDPGGLAAPPVPARGPRAAPAVPVSTRGLTAGGAVLDAVAALSVLAGALPVAAGPVLPEVGEDGVAGVLADPDLMAGEAGAACRGFLAAVPGWAFRDDAVGEAGDEGDRGAGLAAAGEVREDGALIMGAGAGLDTGLFLYLGST